MSNWTQHDIDRLQQKGLKVNLPLKNNTENQLENPKKQKYNNVKTEGFDSKHEYEVYKQLLLRQKVGEITALVCQVTFNLITGVSYKADFTYYDKNTKQFIVADAKGMKTKEYIIKKKMMRELLGIEIMEM